MKLSIPLRHDNYQNEYLILFCRENKIKSHTKMKSFAQIIVYILYIKKT